MLCTDTEITIHYHPQPALYNLSASHPVPASLIPNPSYLSTNHCRPLTITAVVHTISTKLSLVVLFHLSR